MSTILTITRGTGKLIQCSNLNLPIYLIAYTRIPLEKYIKNLRINLTTDEHFVNLHLNNNLSLIQLVTLPK